MGVRKKPTRTITMKRWIFQVDVKRSIILVRGFRVNDFNKSKTGLKYWKSSAIVDRKDSQNLISSTGTVYRLRGPIDIVHGLCLKYPYPLLIQFSNGFPENWQSMLNALRVEVHHFKFKLQPVLSSTKLYSNSTTISAATRQDDDEITKFDDRIVSLSGNDDAENYAESLMDSGQYKDVEKSLQINFASCSSSAIFKVPDISAAPRKRSKVTTNYNGVENLAKQQASCAVVRSCDEAEGHGENNLLCVEHISRPPRTCVNAPSQALIFEKRRTRMCGWSIRYSLEDLGSSVLFSEFGIFLEGFNLNERCDCRTSCIVEVHGGMLVSTASTLYELVGPINTLYATKQGYSDDFISSFIYGFPANWWMVLQTYYDVEIRPRIAPMRQRTYRSLGDDVNRTSLKAISCSSDSKSDVAYDSFVTKTITSFANEMDDEKFRPDCSHLRWSSNVERHESHQYCEQLSLEAHTNTICTNTSQTTTGSESDHKLLPFTPLFRRSVKRNLSSNVSSDAKDDSPIRVVNISSEELAFSQSPDQTLVDKPQNHYYCASVEANSETLKNDNGGLNESLTSELMVGSSVEVQTGRWQLRKRPNGHVPISDYKRIGSKKWKDVEIKKLELAVKAIRPKVDCDSDWDQVARRMKDRNREECRDIAKTKHFIDYDIPTENHFEGKDYKQLSDSKFSAKRGHRLYGAGKAEQYANNYLTSVNSSDYFCESDIGRSHIDEVMPSIAELSTDDSMLDALKTPENVKRPNRRRFIPNLVSPPSLSSTPTDKFSPLVPSISTPRFGKSKNKTKRSRRCN